MALLGISQIGAIVCSLGLLGQCVLSLREGENLERGRDWEGGRGIEDDGPDSEPILDAQAHENSAESTEVTLLLPPQAPPNEDLRGSIAGVYSLAGGLGILILTKAGGNMFDNVSQVAPFYMLALFNMMLLVTAMVLGAFDAWKR